MSRCGNLYPDNDCRHCGTLMPTCRPEAGCRPVMPCSHNDHCRYDDTSFRMRLFDGCDCGWNKCNKPLPPAAPPVTIVNPWNCRERVQVTLSIDECGNLVVYVRR